jgi:hypothetical protein
LIELLVVIAVMSLLISILVPSFRRAREDARRTVCVANLKHIGVGLFTYAGENMDSGPPVMAPMGTTAPRTLLSRVGAPVNLGQLWPRIISDARGFFCPSQSKFSYNSQISLLQTATVTGSYVYAVHVPAERSPRLGAIRHLALASDSFCAYGSGEGIGRFIHKVGYHVLYTDGSATWYSDPDHSIARQSVHWDDETDDITYETLYNPNVQVPDDQYGSAMDIFRVWRAFCYNRPDPFGG